jgi:hypothetical protein
MSTITELEKALTLTTDAAEYDRLQDEINTLKKAATLEANRNRIASGEKAQREHEAKVAAFEKRRVIVEQQRGEVSKGVEGFFALAIEAVRAGTDLVHKTHATRRQIEDLNQEAAALGLDVVVDGISKTDAIIPSNDDPSEYIKIFFTRAMDHVRYLDKMRAAGETDLTAPTVEMMSKGYSHLPK